MMFYYVATLHPGWQYSYALIESNRESAFKYLNDKYSLSEDFIHQNFMVQAHHSLMSISKALKTSIADLQNNQHVLIVDKSELSNMPFGDGCFCLLCKEYYPYTEPNRDDGTMICYMCLNPMFGHVCIKCKKYYPHAESKGSVFVCDKCI